MPTFIRNGKRGAGSEVRRAVGIKGTRLCPTYDGRYHEPETGSGQTDKSWSASMADRVVTREDAKIVQTLRGPRSLDNVNGPLWTRRKASSTGPSTPEVDIMSADGTVDSFIIAGE